VFILVEAIDGFIFAQMQRYFVDIKYRYRLYLANIKRK